MNIKDVFEENKRKKEKENTKKLWGSIKSKSGFVSGLFKIRFAFLVLILEISFGEKRKLFFKTESES